MESIQWTQSRSIYSYINYIYFLKCNSSSSGWKYWNEHKIQLLCLLCAATHLSSPNHSHLVPSPFHPRHSHHIVTNVTELSLPPSSPHCYQWIQPEPHRTCSNIHTYHTPPMNSNTTQPNHTYRVNLTTLSTTLVLMDPKQTTQETPNTSPHWPNLSTIPLTSPHIIQTPFPT